MFISLVTRGIFSLSVVMVAAVAIHAERLPIRAYTTADGISSNAINWVMRDSRRFLWFGTRDGLSRFDGQRFRTYRLEAGKTPSISQIIQRRRGDYLIALQGGGVYRFDAQTTVSAEPAATSDETLILHAERIAENFLGVLFEDREQRLWGAGNGLTAISESGGQLQPHLVDLRIPGQPAPTNITHIIEARDGSFWMSTSIGLLRRAPDGTRKINELVDSGVNYQFVVITGDIGVEKIIEKLHGERAGANPQVRVMRGNR